MTKQELRKEFNKGYNTKEYTITQKDKDYCFFLENKLSKKGFTGLKREFIKTVNKESLTDTQLDNEYFYWLENLATKNL